MLIRCAYFKICVILLITLYTPPVFARRTDLGDDTIYYVPKVTYKPPVPIKQKGDQEVIGYMRRLVDFALDGDYAMVDKTIKQAHNAFSKVRHKHCIMNITENYRNHFGGNYLMYGVPPVLVDC
jgi:hypothetical protein